MLQTHHLGSKPALDVWVCESDHEPVPFYELIAIAAAGVLAGAVNTVAGAGSLLSYPMLVAFGIPPVAANVTNDIGVVPGNLAGVISLRRRLRYQPGLLRQLIPRAVIGALIGAALLLIVPGGAFGWAAPPLLFLASVMTLLQTRLIRWSEGLEGGERIFHGTISTVSVYGGYFGTGIGLLFMAALGVFVNEDAKDLNAIKTLLQLLANGVAGIVFAFAANVHWPAAAAMAAGSVIGGRGGALVADRIPAETLRRLVAVIGIAAAIWLLLRQLT
jgi:uncharacterized protein